MNRWLAKNGTAPVRVDMRRDGTDHTIFVTPVIGCAIPIEYKADEVANASTTDHHIVINSGFLEMTKTDADLAMVIGHELAHSNLGHLDSQRWNTIVGFATGAAIDTGIFAGGVSTGGAFRRQFTKMGMLAYSVGFEREADYVGTYYVARAGYDLKGIEDVWRRIALVHPHSILNAQTHPITATRFVQIQKTRAEIDDKKRRGLPLDPELKRPAERDLNTTVEAAVRR